MFPNENCKRFFYLLDELRPFRDEVKISKNEITILPWCFKGAILGFKHGCLKQFRGPFGLHVREHQTYFLIHRDIADPENSPIAHLIFDVMPPKVSNNSKAIQKILLKMQDHKIKGARKELLKSSRYLIWTAKMIRFFRFNRIIKWHRQFTEKSASVASHLRRHYLAIYTYFILFFLVVCLFSYVFELVQVGFQLVSLAITLTIVSVFLLMLILRKKILMHSLKKECPFYSDSKECYLYYYHLLTQRKEIDPALAEALEEYISYLESLAKVKSKLVSNSLRSFYN